MESVGVALVVEALESREATWKSFFFVPEDLQEIITVFIATFFFFWESDFFSEGISVPRRMESVFSLPLLFLLTAVRISRLLNFFILHGVSLGRVLLFLLFRHLVRLLVPVVRIVILLLEDALEVLSRKTVKQALQGKNVYHLVLLPSLQPVSIGVPL